VKIPPFNLERFFAQYEFSAPYLLCASDCESMSLADLLALEPGAEDAFRQVWLGYTESPGSPALRAEIAQLYTQIAPEDVLVFAGAEEAIFIFMNVALQPGDHLVVHFPGYQSLYQVAEALGCQVTRWQGDPAHGWTLDPEVLRRSLRPNTRAVVINCPHNPTGYLMDRATQAAIVDIVRERGLLLFFDEVYRGLELDPADRLPAACDLYENAVSLGVMSKTYGLAGLRLGWIATRSRALYAAMAAFKDYTTICTAAPSEFLSALALRQRERIAARNLDLIRLNLGTLDAFFARYPAAFDWQRPKAGSVAFPAYRLGDVDAFCHDLAERQGVLLAPGRNFDFGGGRFRIGFGRRNVPDAVARLDTYMQTKGRV